MRHNKVCFVPIRSTMWRFCWCERWSVSVKQATALRRQLSSPIYSLITTERLPWLCSSSLYLSAGALYLLIVIAVLYLELLAINKVYEHLITAESRLLTYVTIWSFFFCCIKASWRFSCFYARQQNGPRVCPFDTLCSPIKKVQVRIRKFLLWDSL